MARHAESDTCGGQVQNGNDTCVAGARRGVERPCFSLAAGSPSTFATAGLILT